MSLRQKAGRADTTRPRAVPPPVGRPDLRHRYAGRGQATVGPERVAGARPDGVAFAGASAGGATETRLQSRTAMPSTFAGGELPAFRLPEAENYVRQVPPLCSISSSRRRLLCW